MSFLKRYNIKAILLAVLWVIVGCASTVLLVAAVRKNDVKRCAGINVSIIGVSNNYFIDKKDVEAMMVKYAGDKLIGRYVHDFDLKQMEGVLKRDIWIKNAEMFFDNNAVLQVDIEEREPVARLFTVDGSTFYIDSSLMMLPLSEKFSARLPVFTGFPSDAKVLRKADSALLKDIYHLSMAIQNDSFLMGMIEQVDITPQRTFEMMPKFGNQLIVFGDASDAKEKFAKLKLFYKNILIKTGWARYSVISLQYKNQVVGKIRGADDVTADSIRTIQIMELIAANAEKMSADSLKTFAQDSDKNTTDSSMIRQSIQREESIESTQTLPVKVETQLPSNVTMDQPLRTVPVIAKPVKINKPLPVENKPAAATKKPKAIMEKKLPVKNDY